ncbi:unnamed protein product [Darwinula stevensoni]|uniref:Uncharacterized protein n=1 Tax=Darwinula stevensoni TaxID=69355 RepID=A0A7R9AC88_9CRUS|nr:unnamed protein product [Darwinula stevensoni]CAG0899783.1 unnamed protein product [Darwinula stevensoni]
MFSTICLKRLLLLGYVILPLVIIRLLEIHGWFLHGKIAHSSSVVDPKTLSASELKALVGTRGLDGAGAVEKQDLMQLLESTGKPTNGELQEAIGCHDPKNDVFSFSFELHTSMMSMTQTMSGSFGCFSFTPPDPPNCFALRAKQLGGSGGALYKNIQWELRQHLHDIRSLKELESEWLNTSSQADGKPLRVVFFTDAQAVPLSLAVLSVRHAKGIQVGVFSSSEETEKEEVSRPASSVALSLGLYRTSLPNDTIGFAFGLTRSPNIELLALEQDPKAKEMFSTICQKRLLLLGYVILPLVIIRLLEIQGWFLHGKFAHSSSVVDTKTLSARELKTLVDRRGLDGAGAVEKQDLMQLLESTGKPTNGELQEAIGCHDPKNDVFSFSFELHTSMMSMTQTMSDGDLFQAMPEKKLAEAMYHLCIGS